MKKPLNLVIRVDDLNEPLICWKQENTNMIGAYFTQGKYHGDIHPDFYYKKTKPIKDDRLKQEIFQNYTKNWEGYSLPRLRKVLG